MSQKILLVEDELSIAEPLTFLLEREGFEVRHADDGQRALSVFTEFRPDLVLLDLMLPGRSGTDVCRTIRLDSDTPIIMLTAKNSETDIVVGLELGADDYITKPYASSELLARIRAVLRRTAVIGDLRDEGSVITRAHVTLDTEKHAVTVHGNLVQMPLREFELLEYLMRNAGRVLTRGQLIDRIWGSDYFGDTKTLDVHIKRIRSRIEERPASPQLLMTVRGVGYRFE
jgi:two-component system, OmpR family, response regulator RegX3